MCVWWGVCVILEVYDFFLYYYTYVIHSSLKDLSKARFGAQTMSPSVYFMVCCILSVCFKVYCLQMHSLST